MIEKTITFIEMPNCKRCNELKELFNKIKPLYPNIKFLETNIFRDDSTLYELKKMDINTMPCLKKEISNKYTTIWGTNIYTLKELKEFIEND